MIDLNREEYNLILTRVNQQSLRFLENAGFLLNKLNSRENFYFITANICHNISNIPTINFYKKKRWQEICIFFQRLSRDAKYDIGQNLVCGGIGSPFNIEHYNRMVEAMRNDGRIPEEPQVENDGDLEDLMVDFDEQEEQPEIRINEVEMEAPRAVRAGNGQRIRFVNNNPLEF